MYLVMISKKECYQAHSAHRDLSAAQEWAKCLQHTGEYDCAICYIDPDSVNELAGMAEGATSERRAS